MASKFNKAERYVKQDGEYKLLSYATSSKSVEMTDGTDLQTKANSIDKAISDETINRTKADTTITNNLNAEITRAKQAENNLASNKIDKTTVATSSALGLVKSGTDITVDSSGNVSVNDNSHKHTVSNISDLTATASELNVLDGITATTTELNYTDGVTSNIQTQLNGKSNNGHTHDDRYYTETEMNTKLNAKLSTSLKGSVNGLAELDKNGKVPSSQLPSYVDDVIEGYYYSSNFYTDSAHATKITGETGKIYIDLSTNKTYRWSGSAFVVISETLALGETSSTAYRGDRGKIAYNHSQTAHAPSNAQANVIETVKVNGTALTPSSKAVNITVPTKVSQLTNDSGYKTTDNNTTYKLTKSGTTITLTGSDGSTTSVTDSSSSVSVINNLTSTSTTAALSANQGKVLNDKISSHGHTYLKGYSQGTPLTSANLPTSTNGAGSIFGFSATGAMTEGKPPTAGANILQMNWDGSGADCQIAVSIIPPHEMYVRGQTNNYWEGWKTLLDSNNYSSYCLPKSGGTVTGNLNVNGAVSASGHAADNTTRKVYLGVSEGNNAGIYDVTNSQWIIKSDTSKNVTLMGKTVNIEVSETPNPTSFKPYLCKSNQQRFEIATAGYVTGNGTNICFFVPCSRYVVGEPTPSAWSANGFIIRQSGKYTHGSSSTTYVKPSSYSVALTPGGFTVTAVMSSTTNAINNAPCGIRWSGVVSLN